jgi:hypothetical protein
MKLLKYLLLLPLVIGTSYADIDLPNKETTPGHVLSIDLDTICIPGYSKTVRNVSGKLKNRVYNLYNVPQEERGRYSSKVDHLIPLSIGGSNDLTNLWPHYYETKSNHGVLKKNQLENKLHKLVCDKEIDIREAQECISSDWISCYNKYVR